jgi:hypothetical protein
MANGSLSEAGPSTTTFPDESHTMSSTNQPATIESEGRVSSLRQLFGAPRRASTPGGDMGGGCSSSKPPPLSSSRAKRWSRTKIDPSQLPPAFQPFQAGAIKSHITIRRNSDIDQQKLEKLVPRQKSTMPPSILKRKWPPVRIKSDITAILRGRATEVVPEQIVQNRRSGYEHHYSPNDKVGIMDRGWRASRKDETRQKITTNCGDRKCTSVHWRLSEETS